MKTKSIKEIMSADVINIPPGTPLSESIAIMRTKNISCLMILQDNKPAGIFTERDIVRAVHCGASLSTVKTDEVVATPVITAEESIDIREAYDIIATNEIRHLAIVDSQGAVAGVVTQTDIINGLGAEYFVELKKISKIMNKNVLSVSAEYSVLDAVHKMAEVSISCIILEEDRRPAGILTERDLARLLFEGADLKTLKMGEVASRPVITITRDFAIQDTVLLMRDKGIRRVVVVDGKGETEGLITQSDLIKSLETEYVRSLKSVIRKKDEKLLEAHKAVQEKSLYLENILQSSTEHAISTTDLDFRITYYNPMAEKLHGYKAEEVIGKRVMEVHTKEEMGSEDFEETISQTGEYRYTLEKTTAEGTRQIIEARISGIYDSHGILVGYSNFSKDVTESKRVEEDLRNAKEQAEEANSLKNKFISLVAHDLRTPLANIIGFIKYIRDETCDPEKTKEIMDLIEGTGNKMYALTEDLLNISRFKTGKIQPRFRFLDAASMASNIIDEFKPVVEKKNLRLINRIVGKKRLFADRELFYEVIRNLMSNAVKFCSEGDAITLFTPGGEPSTIAVSDTGVGIKPGRLGELFKYEEKTSTRGTAGEMGTGLGLPLCKDIMESHGGELSVESRIDKGTTFFARLPHRTPVVMIVDDNGMSRKVLTSYLKILDVDIIEAVNGREALESMKQVIPHVIISDLIMPEMDGFEFVNQVKKEIRTMKIPLIVITADTDIQTRDRVFSLGADDFVTKPVTVEDLNPRVRRFLE